MPPAPLPPNEAERLRALSEYRILDTVPEPVWDDLTRLAAAICGTPIALATLVDRNRNWFKSRIGMDVTETPRDAAFCAHAILQRDLFLVPDATADPRFADNPYVAGEGGIRFYGGCPLVTPDGYAVGALCVVDRRPRELSPSQRDALRALARQAEGQLELRRRIAEVEAALRSAEEAGRAKAQFLATVSHEIRTPLHAVIGMSGLLLGTRLDGEQREFAETIRSSGGALLAVVNDILDYTRIESGGLQVESRPFRPRECVEEALRIVRPSAAAKGLDLRSHLDPGIPGVVDGDGNRLRQVLVNLLGNAVKFTERGSVALVGEAAPAGDSLDLRFRVEDTGPGIPRDLLGNLFRPFSQADASVARRFGGSGLGLAICRGLCERMGGAIGVESEPGRGSAFTFSVRVRPTSGASVSAAPDRETAPRDLPRLGILAVEDDPANRQVLQAMLRSLGQEADEAGDGPSAVRAAAAKDYDAILMDLQMPGMDGIEATARIRALGPRGTRPRIVALTAAVLPEDRARCLQAGMDDFLGKPLRPEDLRRALSAAGSAASGAATPPTDPVLDQRVIGSLQILGQGDRHLLPRLLDLYRQSGTNLVRRIREAVASGAAEAAGRSAHTLRGASLNLGVARVAAVAARMEESGARGNLATLAEDLPRLEAAMEEALPALGERLGGG